MKCEAAAALVNFKSGDALEKSYTHKLDFQLNRTNDQNCRDMYYLKYSTIGSKIFVPLGFRYEAATNAEKLKVSPFWLLPTHKQSQKVKG